MRDAAAFDAQRDGPATASIVTLDKGLDEARSKAWVVVDMKQDWKVVFPPTPR